MTLYSVSPADNKNTLFGLQTVKIDLHDAVITSQES